MMRARVTLERRDKNLKLLQKEEFWSRSFTAGLVRLLYVAHAQIQSGAPYAMVDITNTSQNVDSSVKGNDGEKGSKGTLAVSSPGGEAGQYIPPGIDVGNGSWNGNNVWIRGDNLGIQVGTNNTAVTPTDHAMNTKIAHGRGAGQFEYGGCELSNIVFANPNGSFDIRRYFTNHSGGSITVTESGIYAAGGQNQTYLANMWSFLICRDVFAGVAVLDTQILAVTYTVQITV